MKNIAIVGGGPGGLFTAHILEKTCAGLCKATIFGALARTGGKLETRSFHTAPVLYEAGVAEFYDYSRFGSDPIRDLLERLDLKTNPMLGPAGVIDAKNPHTRRH